MEWRIVQMGSVDSTNLEAAKRAAAGEAEGLVVVAASQTAGRGRLGRSWASAPGGLYLSALLRPEVPAGRLGLLPLACGVAVLRAIERFPLRRAALSLKWPNDLLSGSRKLCGILVESRIESGRVAHAIAGIGVNVANPAPHDAASLSGLARRPIGVSELAGAALSELRGAYDGFLRSPARVAEEWSSRSSTLGSRVRVETEGGALEGVAVRVDEVGALWLRADQGELRVVAGEVVHLSGR